MVNFLTQNFILTRDDSNKMYSSYDFFDKTTLQSLKKHDELKKKPKEFKKYKIYVNKNYNLRYYQGAARQIINHYKLLEPENDEIFIEYLTNDGWISEYKLSRDLKKILAIPSNDKGLPSGYLNASLDNNTTIYGIRLNVFHKPRV